jgi:hypothetical protein
VIDFYTNLPTLLHFKDATEAANFTPVPTDWHIVITDVRGSTKAIEAGKYKEVNTVGALCIAALINIARENNIEIPYVFGGDGVTVLIPPALIAPAEDALLATQSLAKSGFGLDLRVAIVPVIDVLAQDNTLTIAKIRVAIGYTQAAFGGNGLAVAEQWIKGTETYTVIPKSTPIAEADYTGFECRWSDIPSPHEETVTLMIAAQEATLGQQEATLGQQEATLGQQEATLGQQEAMQGQADTLYRQVLESIERIYGDETARHPVHASHLQLSFAPERLSIEAIARKTSVLRLRFLNFLGTLFMNMGVKSGAMDWGRYKQNLIATTDFQKIDGVLRMVISGTVRQRSQLERELEARRIAGELVYGIHVSQAALMTCLVFAYNGEQVHFVDGAEGGYALCAKAIKAQQEG